MRELRKILLSLILAISIVFTCQSNYGINNIDYAKATTKVKINKKYATLSIGETVKLKITGTKKKVTWKSSNKKIATVTNKGKVKCIKEGMATIIAKVDKKKYTCTVIVEEEYENVHVEEVSDDENVKVYVPVYHVPTIAPQTPIGYTTSQPQDLYRASVQKVNEVLSKIPTPMPTTDVANSNAPVLTETSEPTQQPTIKPISTEILSSDIQNNYKKLEEYIIANGYINNDGSVSISRFADNICYTIEYNPINSSYRFMYYFRKDVAANGAIIYIDKNNLNECKIECGMNDSLFHYAYVNTSTELRNVYGGSNLQWEVLTATVIKDNWITVANSWLSIGINGWNVMLSDRVDMNIAELGFGTGTAS